MEKHGNRFLPVLFIGMLFIYTGCAKQEVTRKDEPITREVARQEAAVPAKAATVSEKALAKPVYKAADLPSANMLEKQTSQASESSASAVVRRGMEPVYFAFDAAVLDGAARQVLSNDFALAKGRRVRLRIEGNCDERGSDEYNIALGEKRAQAAANYLVTLGFPRERLSVISFGKEKPADPGHDESAWAKNRRDEFVTMAR